MTKEKRERGGKFTQRFRRNNRNHIQKKNFDQDED